MDLQDAFPRDALQCLDGAVMRKGIHPKAAGGHADVFEGSFAGGTVAIKVARPFASTGKRLKREKLLRRLWREYLAWSRLSHPNVLPCLGYSYDFSPEWYMLPSLISPWMKNGPVTAYLDEHPEADRLKLLLGIAHGLSYLHQQEPAIIHGDVRAGNILVSDQGVPCLTDFGLSRTLEEAKGFTTTTEIAGSVRWMSPELFHIENKISVHSDVWAYGMTVLEILSGQHPYAAMGSDLVVLVAVRDGKIPSRSEDPEVLKVLDDRMWALCNDCWSLQPTRRPSMDSVAARVTEATEAATIVALENAVAERNFLANQNKQLRVLVEKQRAAQMSVGKELQQVRADRDGALAVLRSRYYGDGGSFF